LFHYRQFDNLTERQPAVGSQHRKYTPPGNIYARLAQSAADSSGQLTARPIQEVWDEVLQPMVTLTGNWHLGSCTFHGL
jgi:hypothetical protein